MKDALRLETGTNDELRQHYLESLDAETDTYGAALSNSGSRCHMRIHESRWSNAVGLAPPQVPVSSSRDCRGCGVENGNVHNPIS